MWTRIITPTLVDVFLLACILTMSRDAQRYHYLNARYASLMWYPPCEVGLVISTIGAVLGFAVLWYGRKRQWPGLLSVGLTVVLLWGCMKLLPEVG